MGGEEMEGCIDIDSRTSNIVESLMRQGQLSWEEFSDIVDELIKAGEAGRQRDEKIKVIIEGRPSKHKIFFAETDVKKSLS